jgi:hypothetical protein
MIPRNAILALVVLGAASLGACGKQAELERPKPLIGHGRPPPSAQQLTRDKAAARARDDGLATADPQAPQSVDEVRGQGVQTQREHPVAGANEGPNPSRPPGVLPDPAAQPSRIPE